MRQVYEGCNSPTTSHEVAQMVMLHINSRVYIVAGAQFQNHIGNFTIDFSDIMLDPGWWWWSCVAYATYCKINLGQAPEESRFPSTMFS